MTGSVFTKPYTSAHNIVSLLYAVVFLLPFTHLFYVPLVIALLLALWRVRELGKQELRIGSLRQAGAAFLLCSFLSVINSPDKLFSLFNWCFLPLMYAVLYILIVTYADSRDIWQRIWRLTTGWTPPGSPCCTAGFIPLWKIRTCVLRICL